MAEEPEQNRIRVVMRARPPNTQERGWFKSGEFKHILAPLEQTEDPDHRLIIDESRKTYDYDRIFRDNATQKGIFREAAVPTLDNVFKGYCGAVLAYGQTGTGKTHTMQGYDKSADGDERGIIPRCAEYLFQRVAKEHNYSFDITMSFVQIYLDKLQDLFLPEAPEISIQPDTERVELPGITAKPVRSAEEFMKNYYYGEAHRVTRATLMNPTSSRGHAALIVNVKMKPQDREGLLSTKTGKLVLVDLAGYERFALTGITTGIAAEEAKKINASLLALGSVVNALAEKQKHVPYRNAKLTRLLKDCLGGTAKSTIILTIGPCNKYKQETSGTLYFGWKCMSVKVNARIKEEYDPTRFIANLKEKISVMTKDINKLVKYIKGNNQWSDFISKYGEINIPEPEDDDDDDIMEITSALQRQQTRSTLRPGEGGAPAAAQGEDFFGMDGGTEDAGDAAPAAVKEVRDTYNVELKAHQEQANRELELLRLRHIQDLEEAKAAGVSEEVLANLRKEHDQELDMMREQNVLLRQELVRQKQREEAKALLSSAEEAKSGILGANTSQMSPDDRRVHDMVTHLQETCGNKDEVLVRLFDLICLREAEVKDYELNAQAIVAAQMEDMQAGTSSSKEVAVLRDENENLRNTLLKKDQHIDMLKGLIGSGAGGGSASHTTTTHSYAPAAAAPSTQTGGYTSSYTTRTATPSYTPTTTTRSSYQTSGGSQYTTTYRR